MPLRALGRPGEAANMKHIHLGAEGDEVPCGGPRSFISPASTYDIVAGDLVIV